MTQQPYDSTFKAMFEGREATLIPYLLPRVHYLKELNIEQLHAPLRADRVYEVEYQGISQILHIEIETSGDSEMDVRMLEYHGILHRKYKLPVISMILYPFQTTVVQSPYREFSGNREILTFHFEVVALWKLNARQFVEQKVTSMYSFLPTMGGADAELLLQAIRELRETYEGVALTNQLLWLRTLLHRANVLSVEDKQRVEENLTMFERIFEEDPYIQKMQAKGVAIGELRARRSDIVSIIETHYPQLVDITRQKVSKINQEDLLKSLLLQVVNNLGDEQSIRKLLTDLP